MFGGICLVAAAELTVVYTNLVRLFVQRPDVFPVLEVLVPACKELVSRHGAQPPGDSLTPPHVQISMKMGNMHHSLSID